MVKAPGWAASSAAAWAPASVLNWTWVWAMGSVRSLVPGKAEWSTLESVLASAVLLEQLSVKGREPAKAMATGDLSATE